MDPATDRILFVFLPAERIMRIWWITLTVVWIACVDGGEPHEYRPGAGTLGRVTRVFALELASLHNVHANTGPTDFLPPALGGLETGFDSLANDLAL